MTTQLNPRLRFVAGASLAALIVLCLVWELRAAPLRPGGSLFVLKVFPLLLPLRGVLKGRVYTMQWAAMLILLYFMEGVVRAYSDPVPMSVAMAWVEIILSAAFYFSAVFYVRPAKRAAKAKKREARHEAAS